MYEAFKSIGIGLRYIVIGVVGVIVYLSVGVQSVFKASALHSVDLDKLVVLAAVCALAGFVFNQIVYAWYWKTKHFPRSRYQYSRDRCPEEIKISGENWHESWRAALDVLYYGTEPGRAFEQGSADVRRMFILQHASCLSTTLGFLSGLVLWLIGRDSLVVPPYFFDGELEIQFGGVALAFVLSASNVALTRLIRRGFINRLGGFDLALILTDTRRFRKALAALHRPKES